jgi:2-dehydro-3-deoxygluconokinase
MSDVIGPEVLVSGYASIDLTLHASGPATPGQTVLLHGPVAPPLAWGGCAPAAARSLAGLGRRVGLVTWLGDDEPGRRYLDLLQSEGVDIDAVHVEPGAGTPRSYLIADPVGGAACCYHPSGSGALRAGDVALRMLAGASCLGIMVGPAPLSAALLDHRTAGALLAWSVKADPDAFPLPLRRRLLAESRLICLNQHELPFLLAAIDADDLMEPADALTAFAELSGGTVALTAGADGCLVAWPGGRSWVPATPVAVADATGAGDAFFAAFVDAVLRERSPVVAARAATAYVHDMLVARTQTGGGR